MFTNSDKYNDLPSDEEEITLIKHVKTNTSNLNVKVLGVVVKTISSIVKQVGISLINFSENAIKVSEISDNEYFTNLESLILQINPSNCVLAIPKDSLDYKRINHVISVCNLKTTFKFISNKEIDILDDFKITNSLEYLLMEDDSVKNHMKEINLKLAMKAFCLTADFINYKDRNYKSHFTLSIYTMDNYLCLDRAAFTSLSILPFNTQQNVKMSLYDLLNKCRTSIGSQLLKMWITQPLVSVVDIKKRQDCVEVFKSMYRTIQSECLRKVQNLDQILTKFKNFDMGIDAKSTKQPSFEDLVVLYDCIISANRLNQFTFKRYDGIHSHTIRELFAEPLSKISSKFESYLRLVEKTVDLKEAENRVYVFNRNFDESLKKISSKLDQIRYDIEGQRQTIQNELPYSGKKGNQVKIVECNTLGFLFRIPKKDQPNLLKAQIPGVNIEKVRLNKNEFLFTTPKLRRQCTLYKSTLAQYEESQDLMVKRTFKVACTYWSLLERFIKIIATLDVLTAFAEVATLFNYVRPTIDETGKTVNLVDARHPLVEYVLTSNSFIPNDLYMERDRSRVHITTGPNMGGKSTYIKQVGLIAIMNQIGSFVPCKKAKLPIFKHILCRIGASDIQLRGVSTFLAEMVESAAILRMANEYSLVIIDELGRGTSTHDGFGLSWAIIVDLIERAKCFCLCATHFHEMGSLALEHFGVVNKHLTAQFYDSNNSMTFLYKVKDGVCKKSFGINVAILAKFPPDVIESARNKLKELEHKYSPKHTDLVKDLLRSPTFTEFKNSLQTLALEA